MRIHLNPLVWTSALSLICLFAIASPAHAQSCASTCNSNTACGTACTVTSGICQQMPKPETASAQTTCTTETTCGGVDLPCCTPTTTTTLFCTAQCLNVNSVCVQAEVSTVTTTCGSNSTSTMETSKQKSPDPSGTNCPTEITSGCEGVIDCASS